MTKYQDSDFEIDTADLKYVFWRTQNLGIDVVRPLRHISRADLIALSGIGYVGPSGEPALWYFEYNALSDRECLAIFDSKGNTLHSMEVNANVLHRSTNQALYGSPASATNLANQRATSAGALKAFTNSPSLTYGTTSAYSPGQIVPYSPNTGLPSLSMAQAAVLAHQQAIINQAMVHGSGSATFTNTPDKEIYKKLPNEGMRAGEIVAYRCWPIKNGFLWSTAANRAWAPNEPMMAGEGHLEEGMGVFSFKEMSYAIQEFGQVVYSNYYYEMVFGSIWIWGNIVEHDTGYRAQYAAVRTLDFSKGKSEFNRPPGLTELKKLYQVEGDPDERRPILQTDE